MPIQNQYGTPTTQNHGTFWAAATRGRQFVGGNQAVAAAALAAITPGTTTTYTGGLILYNPVGSGVNAAINYASFMFILAQTNVALIGIGVGASATAITTPGTAIASQCALVGSSNAAQCLLYSPTSATLPVAPYLAKKLAVVGTGATSGISGASGVFNLEGAIILEPGSYACFTSSAAGTASSFYGGFVWEEVGTSVTT